MSSGFLNFADPRIRRAIELYLLSSVTVLEVDPSKEKRFLPGYIDLATSLSYLNRDNSPN